jgi:hypothetical protein
MQRNIESEESSQKKFWKERCIKRRVQRSKRRCDNYYGMPIFRIVLMRFPALYKMISQDGYDLVSGWKKKRHDPYFQNNSVKTFQPHYTID